MLYFIETVAFFEKDTISIPVMKITLNLSTWGLFTGSKSIVRIWVVKWKEKQKERVCSNTNL